MDTNEQTKIYMNSLNKVDATKLINSFIEPWCKHIIPELVPVKCTACCNSCLSIPVETFGHSRTGYTSSGFFACFNCMQTFYPVVIDTDLNNTVMEVNRINEGIFYRAFNLYLKSNKKSKGE